MNYLSAPNNIVPIYHLHGTRLDAESIIVTHDDYIPLFRPNGYRQTKLTMTIRESTTLILGYGLGDTNVLSSVGWSKNIYTEDNEYPYEIIQALWVSSPTENAYRDENGNIIIEINDLKQFLNDLTAFIVHMQEDYDNELAKLEELISKLQEENEEFVQVFIDDRNVRLELIEIQLTRFEHNMITPYIQFLTTSMGKVWEKTKENGAFHMYKKYLIIILDIIVNYDYKKMAPRLFHLTALSLDKVLNYVSKSTSRPLGYSWPATKTWHTRKEEIPLEMLNQLYYYSKQNGLNNLHNELRKLVKET